MGPLTRRLVKKLAQLLAKHGWPAVKRFLKALFGALRGMFGWLAAELKRLMLGWLKWWKGLPLWKKVLYGGPVWWMIDKFADWLIDKLDEWFFPPTPKPLGRRLIGPAFLAGAVVLAVSVALAGGEPGRTSNTPATVEGAVDGAAEPSEASPPVATEPSRSAAVAPAPAVVTAPPSPSTEPTTEPAGTEPVTAEPVTTQPVTTEPSTSEPSTSEPDTTTSGPDTTSGLGATSGPATTSGPDAAAADQPTVAAEQTTAVTAGPGDSVPAKTGVDSRETEWEDAGRAGRVSAPVP